MIIVRDLIEKCTCKGLKINIYCAGCDYNNISGYYKEKLYTAGDDIQKLIQYMDYEVLHYEINKTNDYEYTLLIQVK